MRARIGDMEVTVQADSEVWLGAYLAVVESCPDVLPCYAAERADEAVKLYRQRFPIEMPPDEVRT